MNDLISRQDAIETIRKLPNAGIHWLVSAEAVFDALLKLPSVQPEQRWIPCEERPPEESGIYLVKVPSVLDKIRAEIEEHGRKTRYIDHYDLVGDCLDIIDKYKAEIEDKK